MSDTEGKIEALCDDLEDQYLIVGTGALQRRDSETSDTSQVSSLAGTRRRSRAGRSSQSEGAERKRTKKKMYPKVRTGCDTCKQRKIKCDETKPTCKNCDKSGKRCLGYHPPQPKMFEPSRRQHRLDIASEERLFEYFKSDVAVKLAKYRPLQLGLGFWQHAVPQLAANYPAVRHAMLALAATVEKFESSYSKRATPVATERDPFFALEQQTEVINKLSSELLVPFSNLSRSATLIPLSDLSQSATLICCLLLTLCDLWHFSIPLSFEHVFGGLEVCRIVKKTSPSKSPLPENAEMDGTIMIPAYQYFADCAVVGLDNVNEQNSLLLDEFAERLDPILPAIVANIEEAYAVMDKEFRQIAKLEMGVMDATSLELKSHLSTLLFTFKDSLDSAHPDAAADFKMLRVHHRAACILLDGVAEGTETAYDQHFNDFDFIVSHIEELLLFENNRAWYGMIPPLFLAATKCRSTTLRHRALNMLHQTNQLERLWTSCTAYQIAREVIRMEEERALPFNNRIRLTSIYFDPTRHEIDLGYSMTGSDEMDFATSTIPWARDGDEINTLHKPDSFMMPRNILKVCGYSALMLAFRRESCHCEGTT